jgi:hypothetical protein
VHFTDVCSLMLYCFSLLVVSEFDNKHELLYNTISPFVNTQFTGYGSTCNSLF